jgi:hypothetical protein
MPDIRFSRRRLIGASLLALSPIASPAQPPQPSAEGAAVPHDATPAPAQPVASSSQPAASAPAVSSNGYSLPADLDVKRPAASLGAAAGALSGWWEGGVPLFGFESVVIFEEFKSVSEVVVVLAVKAIRNRPARWRRFTAMVEGPIVKYTAKGEVPTVFRLQDDGNLAGEVDARGQKLTIQFRKRAALL